MTQPTKRRPGRPRGVLPVNLHLAEAQTADECWRRIVKALDDQQITVSEAVDLVRIAEKRLPLVDHEKMRERLELALEAARQATQRSAMLAGPARRATVDVAPNPAAPANGGSA